MNNPTPEELSESAVEIVGGPDINPAEELPKPLEPDVKAFPWLA